MSATTITGNFVDSNTGKPVPYVDIDVFPDGDRTVDPFTTIQADANGNFTYTNPDMANWPDCLFSIRASGYNPAFGTPSAFSGTVSLDEGDTVTADTVGSSGSTAIIIIVVLIIAAAWYFRKEIKL